MKKALALVMAIAMVASMAAVSFAATTLDPTLSTNDADSMGGLVTYTKATDTWT